LGRNSANRRPKSQPSTPRKSKDSLARGLGGSSLVISVLSLAASSCQNWIAWSQLQDQREASIKIEARNPFGTIHRPEVIMKISNLSEKPIRSAEVGASLRMLAPDHVGEIFENMETRSQEIEASGFEPQHILVPEPLDDVQVELWRQGRIILVGALRVKWKDRGAWWSTTAKRCFAWIGEPTRPIACEDLIGMAPAQADAYVQKILQQPPLPNAEYQASVEPNANTN